MHNRKLAILALSATALGGVLVAAPAASASCNVSTQAGCATKTSGAAVSAVVGGPTGLDGTRTITTATAGLLTPNASNANFTGTLAVTVTEAAKLGGNWKVTAKSGPLTYGSSTISAADLSLGSASAPTGVGCLLLTSACTATGGSGGTLDSELDVFSLTGESATTAYTGAYAGTAPLTLAVPNGTPTGTYSGTVTVTLYQ
jgi:hypothetical protein